MDNDLDLRAELQALIDDASYAKGIKVVRASKLAELLERTAQSTDDEVSA